MYMKCIINDIVAIHFFFLNTYQNINTETDKTNLDYISPVLLFQKCLRYMTSCVLKTPLFFKLLISCNKDMKHIFK
jgi:hypothetical protein